VERVDQSHYFRRRAEEELTAAESAADERAAQTHRALAARYEAKANGNLLRDIPKDAPLDGGTLSGDFTILP